MQTNNLADDNDLIATTDPRVAEALRQFQICENYWDYPYREAAIDHAYFVGGELQWDREIRQRLTGAKRPALTFNQLQQFVFGVVNEQKQNPSEAQVNAEANGATEDIARVLQDIVRKTRTKSHGKPHIAALRDMVVGGIGFWELGTEYVSQSSHKQHIIWKRVEGWSSVYIDPMADFPTFHNANYAFKFKDISRDEFKRLFKGKVATTSWDPFNTSLTGWIGQNHIRICEHWYTEYTKRSLIGMEDGTDKFLDEIKPGVDRPLMDANGEFAQIREEDYRKVFMQVISAAEILKEPVEWMTKYIPIIPVMGEKDVVEGRVHIFGMLRAARDPQVAANYMRNHLIEAIGRASKAQYLMDPKHTEDFEEFYENANVENRFFLPAHLLDDTGNQMGPPIPINQNTPVDQIQLAVNTQDTSLQQSMGSYGPTGGQRGTGVESAEAILARQVPGDRANFRYVDAFNEALKYACLQTIAMIPIVMDVPQVVQLEGLDRKPYKAAVYNSQQQPDVQSVQLANGIQGLFDLSRGDYGVEVSVGPSYETKRAETQTSLAALVSSLGNMPDELRIIIPHWIRSMDFPGHEELADQLTPQAIKAQQGDPAAALQQVQMQLQQKDAQMQHMAQIIQELTFEKKAGQTKALADAHIEKGWQDIEMEKIKANSATALTKTQADLTKTAATLAHDQAKTLLGHEISRIQQDKEHLHDVHMSLHDTAHQFAMQESQQEAEPTSEAA